MIFNTTVGVWLSMCRFFISRLITGEGGIDTLMHGTWVYF